MRQTRDQPTDPSHEKVPQTYFPFTKLELQGKIQELSEKIHVDFTFVPIEVAGPGDFQFDFTEVQNKLFIKLGSKEAYLAFLERNGLSQKSPHESLAELRQLAEKEGVVLDHSLPGFMFNRGGLIVLFGIREDRVIEMATKYAAKEKDDKQFVSIDEAKEYIKYLSEKYLYHELGHTMYRVVPPANLARWRGLVEGDQKLRQCVVDVQIDKYPSAEHIPVAEEAFADIFAEVVTNGDAKNRLGDHPAAKEYVEYIIGQILGPSEEEVSE